ncbi:hypothetical protein [Streptomyces ipomoeae]|uniref:hypothetical protein n=1 Tax=Streptomyces ipomoeae TaxID=103232 RepID=UPI0011468424|nr:hypothetical protein [Streptomyces ipomoeae]MDX2939338.1 hypothetical protein [Streptomyces ipomoeae]TQE18801.1 hypothetical protein SipoB123_32740 [Streptomyces ipomoeae]
MIEDQEADHQRHIDSLTLASELWQERFTPVEARARASMIISMIEGYTTRWFLHRVKPESTPAIEQITDVLMDMLHAT